ncbi:MAG TPA: type VII secretion protein EccE, partial [Rugosimonospora sp.]|nr:type VII secretion protein EccE [Rugosimonospora sp.]
RVPRAGLVLGRDRHGEPVAVRLAGPEPVRAVLAGGVRAGALLAVRALALGTQLVVQSSRPEVWEALLRGVSLPGDTVRLVPAGQPVALAPASPLVPQLVVLDTGDPDATAEPAAWRTTLVVRDGVAATDLDALARADLVILQPLSAAEAALAGRALHLGGSQDWLTMIRADMVGVVSRGVVRWLRLSATPIETQVIGAPERPVPETVVSG